jgi:hypothetical protein
MQLISRSDARARALDRFYTGEPCKRGGHVAERYTRSGVCVTCQAMPKKNRAAAPQPAEEAPAADERPISHSDPGQWCDPRKIDAFIEQVFNNGPRIEHERAHAA